MNVCTAGINSRFLLVVIHCGSGVAGEARIAVLAVESGDYGYYRASRKVITARTRR
jgi:hypothetical protein